MYTTENGSMSVRFIVVGLLVLYDLLLNFDH